MKDFNQNKLILSLIKEKFTNNEISLLEIIENFSKEISPSRTSLCEAFRLFGNSKYTWFSGAEEDIRALCEAVLTGYQSVSARHFKNAVLAKTKFFIESDDKKSFFDLCQSIYRSAQQNAPLMYNSDIDFQFVYEEDFYEFEEDIENSLSPIFRDLHSFYVEVTPRSSEIKIKAGNVHKKKFKKSLKRVQPSLFEVLA